MGSRSVVAVALVLGLPLGLITSLLGLLVTGDGDSLCATASAAVPVEISNVPPGPVAGYGHDQLVNAAHVMVAAATLGLTSRDQQIGVMTAMGESGLRVLNYGDQAGPDSRGLFQQRDNGAWGSYEDRMDPYRSAVSFYRVLATIPDRDSMEPTLVANRVQRNADPYYYATFWEPAASVVQALSGVTFQQPAAMTSSSESWYPLGSVQASTQAVANTVGPMFGIRTVGGWRDPATESYDPNGHPAGLALDFMVNDISDGVAAGDRLASYLAENAGRFGVAYVIWQQRIWSPARSAEGWRLMPDRGSPTQNHMDHVHLSLTGEPVGGGFGYCGEGTVSQPANGQGWAPPADGPITSPFGPRPELGGFHYGVDIAPPCEAPIWAGSAGTVAFAGPSSGYGNLIEISHPGGVSTRYGHMYTNGVLVKVGDVVSAGQQIGRVGSAGRSTGCHLHFEVKVDGVQQDPVQYLRGAGVGLSSGAAS